MNRDEAERLLKGGKDGIDQWNSRRAGGEVYILRGPNLSRSNLSKANLTGANLIKADLSRANLSKANLSRASFRGANLSLANLSRANLSEANLRGANLRRTDITRAVLTRADFTSSIVFQTIFADLDLSETNGLESVRHGAPSSVGVDTIVNSRGKITEAFLRGCGLTPWEVLWSRLYDQEMTPPGFAELQYDIFSAWAKGKSLINGCFISYSWADSKFAEKLRDHLMAEGVNVWLDKHDAIAGPLQDQVWRAIQLHHAVVLVLSKDSVQSDWVENELDMARQKEKAEGRNVLCPVALDDAWKGKLDASAGPGDQNRALWRTLKNKLVINFSTWKTKAFGTTFDKLVRGLRVHYTPKGSPAS